MKPAAAVAAFAAMLLLAASGMDGTRASVRQADQDFCRAMAARDLDRFRSLVAEDATFFGSAGATQGREAVAREWSPLFAADAKTVLRWAPRKAEAAASGDLGYTIGEYGLESEGPKGREVARGTYVTIWRRDADGAFRAVVDIGTRPQLLPESEKSWPLPTCR